MNRRLGRSSRTTLAVASAAIFALAGACSQAASPYDPAKLAAAQAIFAKHVPAQADMLQCLSIAAPKFFPVAKQDWDDELAKVGALLAQASFPPGQASQMIGRAASKALMADAGDSTALRARCERDNAWQERWETAQYLLFRSELEKLLVVAK